VPSFGQQRETLELWGRFPARERVEGQVAVLTFDDGPDAEGTPAMLDALDAAGARGTFFVLGEQLMKNIRLGREIVERGHEVGLHGFVHERHSELTPTQARDDLARGLGTVEAATGARPRFYRPPYGCFSEHSYAACEALELEPMYWSAWGEDWGEAPGERIAELVIRDLEAGAIVALHDSARYASRESALPTAEAVPLIAAAAGERGLELVGLAEALAADR